MSQIARQAQPLQHQLDQTHCARNANSNSSLNSMCLYLLFHALPAAIYIHSFWFELECKLPSICAPLIFSSIAVPHFSQIGSCTFFQCNTKESAAPWCLRVPSRILHKDMMEYGKSM